MLIFFLQIDFFTASFCRFYMCLVILIIGQCLLIAAPLKFQNLSAICKEKNEGQYPLRKGKMFRIFILNFSFKVRYAFYVSGFFNPIQDRGQKEPLPPLLVFLPSLLVGIIPQNFMTSLFFATLL